MGGLTIGVWKGRKRRGEIVADGLSLDFIHRLHKHIHTHTLSQTHIHSQFSSSKNACWRITDDQDFKVAVGLKLRNRESLPAARALLC